MAVLIFNIKVLCFIAVIATILDSFLNCYNYKKLIFILIICCALGGVGSKIIDIMMKKELAITSEMSDKNEFPWTHWIMMGMNHYGGYLQEDVDFSYNAGNYEEKKTAEIQELKQRIINYGPKGTLNHLFYTKLSRTWGNSCLAGDDYCHRLPYHEKNLWQRLFGVGEDLHWIVLIYTWLYHILMLWGVFFEGVYSLKVADERNVKYMILRYMVLGVGIFLTIWECNSRYLLPFLPIMILLAARGWETVLLKSSDK